MEPESFTILLVDDNPVNRKLGAAHLARAGYGVLTAEDGEAALELLHTHSDPSHSGPSSSGPSLAVDLVLLDIMMPGLSGLEVLTALRLEYSPEELPVVMATAKDQSADMVEAFDLGANDYVTKPLDWAVVVARLQGHLRTRAWVRQQQVSVDDSGSGIGPGAVLVDRYELDEALGEGRFGVVYRGRHLELDRLVAIKVLHAGMPTDQQSVRRFEREGISACRIQHNNAVAILDFSFTPSGVPFLVMELLDGEPLNQELARGPLDALRSCDILIPVCEVLAEAHGEGIIHRDIKPHNIFLHRASDREVVKVVDFGIATFIDDARWNSRVTIPGNRPGTPAYMAPERFTDEPCEGGVDIYSLGVTLFELLTGQLPFQVDDGNLLKVIHKHLTEEPPCLRSMRPDIPVELAELFTRALAKEPEQRPTPLEMRESLESVRRTLRGAADVPPPVSPGVVLPSGAGHG